VLDHISITVTDFERSKQFYRAALGAIGLQLLAEFPAAVTGHTDVAGFGATKSEFWINRGTASQLGVHIAFAVTSREAVDQFYAAALEAGGTDNGAPGIRAHYHPDYYGAFVFDPDGHNIEAVCRQPTSARKQTADEK